MITTQLNAIVPRVHGNCLFNSPGLCHSEIQRSQSPGVDPTCSVTNRAGLGTATEELPNTARGYDHDAHHKQQEQHSTTRSNMPRARYYRARDSSSSVLTTSSASTSLYVIPEDVSTDCLTVGPSNAGSLHQSSLNERDSAIEASPNDRHPSWTPGDETLWTVRGITQASGSISPNATLTKWPLNPRNRRSRPASLASNRIKARQSKTRPASTNSFANFLGGLFRSPFSANNPYNVEQSTSSAHDGPYPVLPRKSNRYSMD